jgi:hypothetical protein
MSNLRPFYGTPSDTFWCAAHLSVTRSALRGSIYAKELKGRKLQLREAEPVKV